MHAKHASTQAHKHVYKQACRERKRASIQAREHSEECWSAESMQARQAHDLAD